MSVVNIGVAAIVVNSQLVAVILEDITCISCIISSCQNIYLAASEALLNSTVSFVYPRALLKVKINFSILCIGALSSLCSSVIFPIFIISHTTPGGIFRSKSQRNNRYAIIIGSSTIGLVQNAQVTFQNNLTTSCTSHIAF